MPIGAVAGRAELMAVFDLDASGHARVPHAGTFNANPFQLSASNALLTEIHDHPSLYGHLNRLGDKARQRINAFAKRANVPLLATGAQSMFQLHFGLEGLRDYQDFARRNVKFRQHLFLYMAVHGIYVPPSGTLFIAATHTDEEIEEFLHRVECFVADELR
jgi:glutamate-1-semialdehyde 2,1-aminomutase